MKNNIVNRIAIILLLLVICVPVFATNWQKEDELDDFGDPTGKCTVFLANQEGTYTSTGNGAKNSKMTWSFYYSKATSKCWFVIKEGIVDANLSTAKYTSDKYSISIKNEDGNVYKYSGKISSNGNVYNAILMDDLSVAYRLAKSSSIKIVITAENGSGSYSLGSVESSDFRKLAFETYAQAEELVNLGKYDDAYELMDKVYRQNSKEYLGVGYSDLEILARQKESGIFMGPAGGWVFYDCDADNESGNADGLRSNECGWRYLEAAPADLDNKYPWGDFGNYNTKSEIGSGNVNTSAIVEKSKKETSTAAAACLNYEINGYDDWYLPSKEELSLMYEKLFRIGIGSFSHAYNADYWSSSEATNDNYSSEKAWSLFFGSGYTNQPGRAFWGWVRPIRSYK